VPARGVGHFVDASTLPMTDPDQPEPEPEQYNVIGSWPPATEAPADDVAALRAYSRALEGSVKALQAAVAALQGGATVKVEEGAVSAEKKVRDAPALHSQQCRWLTG
jgi:hypothetical protein